MRRRRDNRKWLFVLIIFVIAFLFGFLKNRESEEVGAASLDNFDPGYIISDYQMSNYTSMTEAEIQKFLTAKNPCNNTNEAAYKEMTEKYPNISWHFENGHFICLSEEKFGDGEVIGKGDTAAHIIWQAAQDYKINPQVLIVLLEKEQSLITDTFPNSRQYRAATGYGCPDTAACSSKYYGFKNQVRNAAAMFRTVLDGGWTNYPLGKNYIQYNPNADCGGSIVDVKNLATSALYRYTPYQPNAAALAAGYGLATCGAYGNRNFYLYFEDWFGGITKTGSISAPRSVKAKKTEKGILISWNEPSDAANYKILRYELVLTNEDKEEIKAKVKEDAREYLFTDLKDGVYVKATVKVVAESTSNTAKASFSYAFGELPKAPTGLKAEKYNGGIRISWNKLTEKEVVGITKYEVIIADVDKNEYKQEVSVDKNSVIFYGLPLNDYFAASVKVFNKIGSEYSRITFEIRNYAVLSEGKAYNGFKDMPSDDISKKAVSWAVNNGITDKNEYFNGEDPLTRRQAVVMLWRLAGKPDVTIYKNFKDMPADETSKKAVSWAVNNGITDKNEYFNGEDPLTRRQATVLLKRLYDYLGKN